MYSCINLLSVWQFLILCFVWNLISKYKHPEFLSEQVECSKIFIFSIIRKFLFDKKLISVYYFIVYKRVNFSRNNNRMKNNFRDTYSLYCILMKVYLNRIQLKNKWKCLLVTCLIIWYFPFIAFLYYKKDRKFMNEKLWLNFLTRISDF